MIDAPPSATMWRQRTQIIAAMTMAALILLGLHAGMKAMLTRLSMAELRAGATTTATPYADSLSNAINERMSLVRGLVAFVMAEAGEPDFDREFAIYANQLRQGLTGIRNIGVAPDFVVRHINPIAGNERTIGHYFLKDPRPGFVEKVRRAIETGDVVSHGPLPLIQGGHGLIARQAVFIDGRVWGAVGIVFDLQPVLDRANLPALAEHYRFAIRRDTGDTITGDPRVFDDDPVVQPILLPDGIWQLAVVPRQGWRGAPAGGALFSVLFLVASLLIEVIIVLAMNRHFSLIHRLCEREHSEILLRAARDAAEEANAAKSRFLAAASHDLRQPVHTQQLLLSAIKDSVTTSDGRRCAATDDLMAEMGLAIDTQSDLLHALLDVSRLDAGIVVPVLADCNLHALLCQLQQRFQRMAIAHEVRLEVVMSSCVIRTDATLFLQILANLVSNAIKFSPGGTVLVGCRRRAGQVEIQVCDNGMGIPAHMSEVIFQEFRQLGNDARQIELGLGLGLAIARRIAVLLGHDVRVTSQLGRGSVFSIDVPIQLGAVNNAPKGIT